MKLKAIKPNRTYKAGTRLENKLQVLTNVYALKENELQTWIDSNIGKHKNALTIKAKLKSKLAIINEYQDMKKALVNVGDNAKINNDKFNDYSTMLDSLKERKNAINNALNKDYCKTSSTDLKIELKQVNEKIETIERLLHMLSYDPISTKQEKIDRINVKMAELKKDFKTFRVNNRLIDIDSNDDLLYLVELFEKYNDFITDFENKSSEYRKLESNYFCNVKKLEDHKKRVITILNNKKKNISRRYYTPLSRTEKDTLIKEYQERKQAKTENKKSAAIKKYSVLRSEGKIIRVSRDSWNGYDIEESYEKQKKAISNYINIKKVDYTKYISPCNTRYNLVVEFHFMELKNKSLIRCGGAMYYHITTKLQNINKIIFELYKEVTKEDAKEDKHVIKRLNRKVNYFTRSIEIIACGRSCIIPQGATFEDVEKKIKRMTEYFYLLRGLEQSATKTETGNKTDIKINDNLLIGVSYNLVNTVLNKCLQVGKGYKLKMHEVNKTVTDSKTGKETVIKLKEPLIDENGNFQYTSVGVSSGNSYQKILQGLQRDIKEGAYIIDTLNSGKILSNEFINYLYSFSFGDGMDLLQSCALAIIEGSHNNTLDPYFLEKRYIKKVLNKKVWIKENNIKTIEKESCIVSDGFTNARNEIEMHRGVQVLNNKYTYISMVSDNPDVETDNIIYKRLPKYYDNNPMYIDTEVKNIVSCMVVKNGVETRQDFVFLSGTDYYTNMVDLLDSLQLNERQKKVLDLRLQGYGYYAIGTYLNVDKANINRTRKQIVAKLEKLGITDKTSKEKVVDITNESIYNGIRFKMALVKLEDIKNVITFDDTNKWIDPTIWKTKHKIINEKLYNKIEVFDKNNISHKYKLHNSRFINGKETKGSRIVKYSCINEFLCPVNLIRHYNNNLELLKNSLNNKYNRVVFIGDDGNNYSFDHIKQLASQN